jgi:hypothetical protein
MRGFKKLGNFFHQSTTRNSLQQGAIYREGGGLLGRGYFLIIKKVDVTICQMEDGFFMMVLVHNQQIQGLSQQHTRMNRTSQLAFLNYLLFRLMLELNSIVLFRQREPRMIGHRHADSLVTKAKESE